MTSELKFPLVAHEKPAARQWMRMRPVADAHLAQSRHWILEAARATSGGRALVLGAGRCEEIPLAEMAARYDDVVLVDEEADSLDSAVQLLAEPAHARITLNAVDLTGTAASLGAAVDTALLDACSPAEALDAMAGAARNVAVEPILPEGRFDLVVASCLLSQLHVTSATRAANAFLARFPDAGSQLQHATAWSEALLDLSGRMEDALMAQLPSLVGENGRVYLSATVQLSIVHATGEGDWVTNGWYRMTRSLDLRDCVPAGLKVLSAARWSWVVSPPSVRGEWGRLYNVEALVLAKA